MLDYEQTFRAQVIDDFAASYLAGETPIPCALQPAHQVRRSAADGAGAGADALATGHYVERKDESGGPALYRAADAGRDQSISCLRQRDQLAFLRFPLGGLPKAETRAIASRLGLPVAGKKDSQDICFVPSGDYARLVKRLRPEAHKPGEIVDLFGRVLGRHSGIARFTVGQRRGLGVSSDRPLYVVRLEPETARVVVGPVEALIRERVLLREVNWLETSRCRPRICQSR